MLGTMTYRQGSVVLVPFPFSDLSTTKQRPALIVSANWYNQSKDDCVLAAITSTVRQKKGEILIHGSHVQEAGLFQDSVVKTGKLFTIEQKLIRKSLGSLPRGLLVRVLEEVQAVFHD